MNATRRLRLVRSERIGRIVGIASRAARREPAAIVPRSALTALATKAAASAGTDLPEAMASSGAATALAGGAPDV